MGTFTQNYTIAGLETATFYVTSAGIYTLSAKISLPQPSQGAATPSTVQTVVKQNSTTLLTTTAGASGFSLVVNAAAGDEIQVILSSSTAQDEVLNAVKAVISMG